MRFYAQTIAKYAPICTVYFIQKKKIGIINGNNKMYF